MTVLRHPTHSRRYSEPLMRARDKAFEDGLFEWVPNGRTKVRCTICTGQGPSAYGLPGGAWMDRHLDGHTTCWCGRIVGTPTLKQHQGSRHHPKRGTR